MIIWNWLQDVSSGNAPLVLALLASLWVLAFTLTLSYTTYGMTVYASGVFFSIGGVGLVSLIFGTELRVAAYAIFGLLILSAVLCFILAIMLELQRDREACERERLFDRLQGRDRRNLQYTLPDRDNTYVQSRLNTALHVPEYGEHGEGAQKNKETVRLGYARRLLAKVKEAPLTPAERLETEEISRLFAYYLTKENWDAAELRAVNDLFSCVLKMSAKYSVAV